jgi:CheY-like chemotaxis protein
LIGSMEEATKASLDIMDDLAQLGAQMGPNTVAPQPTSSAPRSIQQQQHQPYASTINSSYSATPELVKAEYQSPTKDTFTSPTTSPDSQSYPNGSGPPLDDTEAPFSIFNNFQFPTTLADQPSGDPQHTGGLRVFTTGYLAPRQDDDDLTPEGLPVHPPPNIPAGKEQDDEDDRPANSIRVRRKTFVPGWAVPPKILLVDDDAVVRSVYSKFLQVFGCEADIAVDGMAALKKMGMEKYDLILMDVVMPNLDGIAATSHIRKFDATTPIISMTSNTFPADIMNYRNSGSTLCTRGSGKLMG